MEAKPSISYDSNGNYYVCAGAWNLAHLNTLKTSLASIHPDNNDAVFDGKQITAMDSAGALTFQQFLNKLTQQGIQSKLKNLAESHQKLLTIVEQKLKKSTAESKNLVEQSSLTPLEEIGKVSTLQYQDFLEYLSFIGFLSLEGLRIFSKTSRIRIAAISNAVYRTGVQALPIIALLSFMVGVVITYQTGVQLRSYGANIYIVDLLGLAILREFGPLLTAIMVAGRTGSAFTAQLGIMKINQEIDALNTMGVTPAELLLWPRIIGLLIALPLLTIWADIFGIFGGMVMANSMLDISWYDFLERFPEVIKLKNLFIGLGKAPVFALIIATVGCYEGMKVKENADSLGLNTTRSVVLSIFYIIVVDAVFSIIFSKLQL